MKRIEIQKLKSIESLVFEIPVPGVYLLAGHNGAGKSSLLACLLRLGDGNAFPRFFRSSPISDQVDQFNRASIIYNIDGEEVTYSYRGQRWVPSPKRHSELLAKFGYGAVLHIAADAKRIEPRPDDFKPRRLKDAPMAIREAAEAIFGQEKYRYLKTINVRRGVGAEAFLFAEVAPAGASSRYYSERNFSLGELCVLKLLRELGDCPNGALLLIDELELALHPRAQVGLVRYLEKIAAEKGLTVLFSTHSPSLIRAVPRDRVFFISVDGDRHQCIRGCYPAFALGQISVQSETSPDLVIYVEDDVAKAIAGALVTEILAKKFSTGPRPTVVVIPVGGFMSVVRFLNRAESILPGSTRQYALLDEDVKSESLEEAKAGQKFQVLDEFKSVEARLRYLPWTPELGMCALLGKNRALVEVEVRKFFEDDRINLSPIENSKITTLVGGAARREAKRQLTQLVLQIARLRVWDEQRAWDHVAQFVVMKTMSDAASSKALYELLMPMLRS